MSPRATAATDKPSGRTRRPTTTATFGSGRREGHDATPFYERFTPPDLSTDTTVNPAGRLDVIHRSDARTMSAVASNSVALVVTSPPYFAGKQYEESLGENGVPATYFEYLTMLGDVFAECKRVLEPGGRIAVNVANLGRKPYRSLAGDVTQILSDLGLLLRGEVVWWKGRAAGSSCAWGSFQRPGNPVLRDVTERIVIAGKGRFDRAFTARQRAERDLPSTTTISRDDFMEFTTDLWEIPPESATRVGHPAPFPVALPLRLIDLYTYEGDVVLDPFMGSGSTAVAALRTDRHFIGFDTDPEYVAAAEARLADERARAAELDDLPRRRVRIPAVKPDDTEDDFQARAVREGRQAKEIAQLVLSDAGFTDLRTNVKRNDLGVELNVVATDQTGSEWVFDISGSLTSSRSGLARTDTLWKALGKAAVLQAGGETRPLVLLTTDLPARNSAGDKALRTARGPSGAVFDALALFDEADLARLTEYAIAGPPDR